jgi:hypothetical protein
MEGSRCRSGRRVLDAGPAGGSWALLTAGRRGSVAAASFIRGEIRELGQNGSWAS